MPAPKDWSVSRPLGTGGPFTVSSGERSFSVFAPDAALGLEDGTLVLEWRLQLAPGRHTEASWSLSLDDPALVVQGAAGAGRPGGRRPAGCGRGPAHRPVAGCRARTTSTTCGRAAADQPATRSYAAGVPWFLTLFGRDKLWAARMMLPARHRPGRRHAAGARPPAGRRGRPRDRRGSPARSCTSCAAGVRAARRGPRLPARTTAPSTPPALGQPAARRWRWGLPDDEVRGAAARPGGARSAGWRARRPGRRRPGRVRRHHRARPGQPGLEGLRRRGAVPGRAPGRRRRSRWPRCRGTRTRQRSRGAALLDAFGRPGRRPSWREYAAGWGRRFRAAFWVEAPDGRYPALALDAGQAAGRLR